jgi:hypothetical protein
VESKVKLLREYIRGILLREGPEIDKIFTLVIHGNGQYARDFVRTLHLDIDEVFFQKLFDHANDIMERSGTFVPNQQIGPDPPRNKFSALKNSKIFAEWETFREGVEGFLGKKVGNWALLGSTVHPPSVKAKVSLGWIKKPSEAVGRWNKLWKESLEIEATP